MRLLVALLLFLYATSAAQASKVIIYAAGTTGQETMELQVKRATVRTFRRVRTGNYRTYQYSTPERLFISNLRVAYTNDGVHRGRQMSLRVDRVNLDGVDYFSRDPSTFTTGTWTRETGFASGYKQSRQLHHNGYFRYSRTAPTSNNSNNNSNQSNSQSTNSSSTDGMTLTFSDEFNGNQLDTSKWNIGSPFNARINREEQVYLPQQVRVSGGSLRLTAERIPTQFNNQTLPFRSGMINTEGKFKQRYGVYEIRARLPSGNGYWPAFWTLEFDPAVFRKEIDIMETVGSRPMLSSFNYHHPAANDQRQSYFGQWIGPDFTKAFHTYTLDWTSNRLIWLVDGVERYRLERPAVPTPRVDMYLLVNLAVGGIYPDAVNEPPDHTTPQRASLVVDYVRVYQR